MCARFVLAGALALGVRAAALQLRANGTSDASRALLIDIRGPTRATGDGVRVMGMIMDLQACGHHVDVFSDALNYTEVKESWPDEVSMSFLSNVRFWKAVKNDHPDGFNLDDYDRFLIGAKLDLLYTDGREGFAVPYILSALRSKSAYRQHVVAFWDDVPFERCQLKPEATEICPRAPAVVREVSQVAHKFYVLSVDDKERMSIDMRAHGIPMDNLEVNVWPMRISDMQRVVPYEPFTPNSATRDLVVMMGNLHAVNRLMVTTLFSSGAVNSICTEIANRGSGMTILFAGGLAEVAEEQRRLRPLASECVEVHTGYMTDSELATDVFPRTRAVLNPFFEDVNSGISVKNFESIMSGVPFVTSEFGMHGLGDEMQACAAFPMPSQPGNTTDFVQFFINNVVSETGYAAFADAFAAQATKCIQGQQDKYPVHRMC